MATRIQLRRGTSEDWESANPILSYGEVGIEIDNKRFRIGDGDTAWNSLPYFQDAESITGEPPIEFNTLEKIAEALIISGGTSGQVLVKSSEEDYEIEWSSIALSDLSDVADGTPENKDMIIYSSSTSSWTRRPAGPRIFVQPTEPIAEDTNDLWIW
jgi:hypothetical protein